MHLACPSSVWSFYGGGVQTEQFEFETEFMLRDFCGAQAVHLNKQILEKAYGARIVRVSKGRAGHVFQSPVKSNFDIANLAAKSSPLS